MSKPIALTIAGFDPCGGAGLQADLKTFHAHGVYGLSVATAITVQNTQGVQAVYPLPAEQVYAQINNLLDDFTITSVKIGMLGSDENARVVAEILKKNQFEKIIIDPIINSQSGLELNDKKCLRIMQREIIPDTTLITPNTEEASKICRFPVNNIDDMRECAKYLHDKMGCRYVLIKGGHLEGYESIDLLYNGEKFATRQWPRIEGDSPHGTGCVLSAAITANLAKGQGMVDAVTNAQNYLHKIRQQALKLGGGYPLLIH